MERVGEEEEEDSNALDLEGEALFRLLSFGADVGRDMLKRYRNEGLKQKMW